MMSLMPTAMPRSGPAPAARTVLARQTKAPMVLSCASIASHDWLIAVAAERSPDSIRRWSSARDIIGIVPFRRSKSFYGPDRDRARTASVIPERAKREPEIKTSSTAHLTDDQRIDWLRLIRSDNVGPRGIMAQTPQEIERADSRGFGRASLKLRRYVYRLRGTRHPKA